MLNIVVSFHNCLCRNVKVFFFWENSYCSQCVANITYFVLLSCVLLVNYSVLCLLWIGVRLFFFSVQCLFFCVNCVCQIGLPTNRSIITGHPSSCPLDLKGRQCRGVWVSYMQSGQCRSHKCICFANVHVTVWILWCTDGWRKQMLLFNEQFSHVLSILWKRSDILGNH